MTILLLIKELCFLFVMYTRREREVGGRGVFIYFWTCFRGRLIEGGVYPRGEFIKNIKLWRGRLFERGVYSNEGVYSKKYGTT